MSSRRYYPERLHEQPALFLKAAASISHRGGCTGLMVGNSVLEQKILLKCLKVLENLLKTLLYIITFMRACAYRWPL